MSLQGPARQRCVRRIGRSLLRRPCIPLLAVLAATPAAAKCHLYSVWHYPKPQRCFTAQASFHVKQDANDDQHVSESHQHVSGFANVPREQIEIPLPALDFEQAPEGDERLRGIAILRSLLDQPP